MLKRLAMLVAVVGLLGCSDRDELKQDGGPTDLGKELGQPDLAAPDIPAPDLPAVDLSPPDAGAPDVGPDFYGAGDMGPFTCNKDCFDYVVDRVLLPMTSTTAQQYSLEFKGKKYNALGNILALLANQAPGLDMQSGMDNAVCAGKTIDLLRVKAASLTSGSALGHSWVGADAKCCALSSCLDPYSTTKCLASATAKCFAGTGTFKPDPKYPKVMLLFGTIANKQVSLGPGKLIVRVTLSSLGSMDLALVGATIHGTIDSAGITSGVLAGGIPETVLNNSVIPNIAQILDGLLKDPLIDSSTKTMIKTLFDSNSDGSISTAEVMNNALIKTFLAGDVDLDGDGKMELSVGLGFTAVKGTITP